MYNAESALFLQAVHELGYIAETLGGRHDTALGLAGAGDLYVTCRAGRNSRMGRLFGLGLTFREARSEMATDTVEGADLALSVGPTLRAMIDRGSLESARLPLARAILAVICDGKTFAFDFAGVRYSSS